MIRDDGLRIVLGGNRESLVLGGSVVVGVHEVSSRGSESIVQSLQEQIQGNVGVEDSGRGGNSSAAGLDGEGSIRSQETNGSGLVVSVNSSELKQEVDGVGDNTINNVGDELRGVLREDSLSIGGGEVRNVGSVDEVLEEVLESVGLELSSGIDAREAGVLD